MSRGIDIGQTPSATAGNAIINRYKIIRLKNTLFQEIPTGNRIVFVSLDKRFMEVKEKVLMALRSLEFMDILNQVLQPLRSKL